MQKIQFLNCTYHFCEQRIARTSLCKFLLIVTNIVIQSQPIELTDHLAVPLAVVHWNIGAIDYLLRVIVQDFSRRKECIFSNYTHISVINLLIFKKGQLRCFEIWSFHRFCLILLEKT